METRRFQTLPYQPPAPILALYEDPGPGPQSVCVEASQSGTQYRGLLVAFFLGIAGIADNLLLDDQAIAPHLRLTGMEHQPPFDLCNQLLSTGFAPSVKPQPADRRLGLEKDALKQLIPLDRVGVGTGRILRAVS